MQSIYPSKKDFKTFYSFRQHLSFLQQIFFTADKATYQGNVGFKFGSTKIFAKGMYNIFPFFSNAALRNQPYGIGY